MPRELVAIFSLLLLSTTAAAFSPRAAPASFASSSSFASHRNRIITAKAPPAADDTTNNFSELRRQLLAPVLFSTLGGRVAWLVTHKEDIGSIEFGEPQFDIDKAAAAIDDTAACAVQSCYDIKLREQQMFLDTSKAAVAKNSKGQSADRLPVVYLEPIFGMSPSARASYRLIMTAPERADRVRLMWMSNKETGEVLVSKAFSPGQPQDAPTIIATLLEPFGGVRRGSKVRPYIFYENDGLWEGAEITLCDPATTSSSCGSATGAYGPADFPIDARARRPRDEVGRELLGKVGRVARSGAAP